MSELSLAFLGPVSIVYIQRPLTHFRTKAVKGLLIYLASQPAKAHTRESLMAMMWPDTLPKSAQGNLRHALYHLRRLIPVVESKSGDQGPFILADRQTIQLNQDSHYDLDVNRFELLTQSDNSIAELELAVSLYRDDFLIDFFLPDSPNFESWAQVRREGLRRLLLDTLSRLTEHYGQSNQLKLAEESVRRQLKVDNLREEAHRQLMRVLTQDGRRTDALGHYQEMRELLREELGIDPSAETEDLAEAIRNESVRGETSAGIGRDDSGIVKVIQSTIRHNLPVQTTIFIGREPELETLDALMEDPQTRLVTITGPGGMGKSRLSLAVAERQLAAQKFIDGIFFVPLAGLEDSERIVSVIAEAMGLSLEQGERQLLGYLRNKQVLLVLDNFEHLLDGSDLLLRLLDAAPQLQILVTTRERLRLLGEQVFPIHGLSVDEKAAIDDARQLFLQTAGRIRPDFQQASENLPLLNRICHLVEGMPLALELAAAWVDTLSLSDIVSEIERNLEFLETDLRDIPSRHRSMRAVFDTTWQNLSADNQTLMAQVSVFRGGFSREAADAIAKVSLRHLATLVNKSLVRFDPVTNRYHIHELLRQYSAGQLTSTESRDRHSVYYLELVVRQYEKVTGSGQDEAFELIDLEMDNIRAAINHALRRRQIDRFIPVMQTLMECYHSRSRPVEGALLFDHVRRELSDSPEGSPRTLFWAIALQVTFLGSIGNATEARALWGEAQTILEYLMAKDGDFREEEAFAHYVVGYDLYADRPADSRRLSQQSYELSMERGDFWAAAHAMTLHSRAARNEGDLEAAEASVKEALRLFQSIGDRLNVISLQLLSGNLAAIAGRFEEAERQLLEGIKALRPLNRPWTLANSGVGKLQMVYFFSGRFDEAISPLEESRQLSEEYGFHWGLAQYNLSMGALHLHQGEFWEARAGANQTIELIREHGLLDFFTCEALPLLAQAELALENYELAETHLRNCDTLCETRPVGMPTYVAGNSLYWGILAAAKGETAVAWEYMRSELEGAVGRKDRLNQANALAGIAFLDAIENKAPSALERYSLAQQHPFVANSRWFADVVGERVQAVSKSLSPDEIEAIRERCAHIDLETAAAAMLAQMDTHA